MRRKTCLLSRHNGDCPRKQWIHCLTQYRFRGHDQASRPRVEVCPGVELVGAGRIVVVAKAEVERQVGRDPEVVLNETAQKPGAPRRSRPPGLTPRGGVGKSQEEIRVGEPGEAISETIRTKHRLDGSIGLLRSILTTCFDAVPAGNIGYLVTQLKRFFSRVCLRHLKDRMETGDVHGWDIPHLAGNLRQTLDAERVNQLLTAKRS